MEMMVKINKAKICAIRLKNDNVKISEIAKAACMAYTTTKHIIENGKDSVEATTVEKIERIAKALGTTVKAITIGKPYERYPKKAAPAKSGTKAPKKAAVKTTDANPKKPAPAKTKKCGTATVQAAPLEIPEAKLPENIRTDSSVMDKLAELQDRIAKLEKIVLKNSSRKKLVKVD